MFNKLLFLFFLIGSILSFNSILIAQEEIKASFRLEGDKIVIEFIIENADASLEYEVKEVLLRKEGDILFKYSPLYLEGDLGTGYYGMKQNKIFWKYTEEEKQKLGNGSSYYFDITIEKTGGGLPWYTYVGGTVLAVSGAIVAILLGKDDETVSSQNIPDPPVRP